jgi:4-amino-4-deoxy-L-arabinose transferase-like glycosyltransferase
LTAGTVNTFWRSKVIITQSQLEQSSAPVSSRLRTDWIVLAGFCAFLFFFGLAYFGLVGADEPRYAQVAREMLARHDWITPTLGGVPWLEKPPLYYWQAMLAYAVFGVSDWAARLPSAVDATILVIAIYWLLRRLRPGSELNAALMTASAAGVIGFARAASTDMPLAAMFSIALLAWYAWWETSSNKFLALAWVFLALATLAKGPVAPLLAALVIFLFAVARGGYSLLRRTLWLPCILVFCVVALPWYVAVQIKNPEFFRVFFLQHNLARFGSNLYHHKEPFWYFVPLALLGLLPWTALAVSSLAQAIRACWSDRQKKAYSQDPLNVFLVIWLLVPILFFSFSQSKLPGYILPALPAGALLIAVNIRSRLNANQRLGNVLIVCHSIVAAALIIPALMIQYLVLQHRLPWGKATGISVALFAMLAAGIAISLRSRLGLSSMRFVTLVVVVVGVGSVLRLGSPVLDSTLSARPVANELTAMESRSLPVAVLNVKRETEYGLAFYRNQIIYRYERGEIPTTAHLVIAPEGSQVSLAKQVPNRRVSYLGSFAPQGLDYYYVAQAGSSIVVGRAVAK